MKIIKIELTPFELSQLIRACEERYPNMKVRRDRNPGPHWDNSFGALETAWDKLEAAQQKEFES